MPVAKTGLLSYQVLLTHLVYSGIGAKRSRTERLSHRLKGPAPPSPSHPEGNAGLSQVR